MRRPQVVSKQHEVYAFLCIMNRILKRRIHSILWAIALFFFAAYIYVSSRSANMALYEWLGIDYYNSFFEYIRDHSVVLAPWVRFNLPDGLWIFSFLLFMEGIWGNDRHMKWIFCIIIVVFAFVVEFIQFIGYFPGTGDIWDILAYIIAIMLFLIINKLKQISYEKNN